MSVSCQELSEKELKQLRRSAGLRDLAAHKYQSLDMSAVWNVAQDRIPEILDFIAQWQNE